jgi:nucleotide-binding universal stress UspA family protein
MALDIEAGERFRVPDSNVVAPVLVVGLDGSPSSWNALAWAAGEAVRVNGTLVAVYVIPLTSAVAAFEVPYDYAGVEHARQEVGDHLKCQAARHAAELGVELSFVVARGEATRALVETSRSLHASLLVVGRSQKVLHRLTGSLGHRLTSRNDAPVVVVVP